MEFKKSTIDRRIFNTVDNAPPKKKKKRKLIGKPKTVTGTTEETEIVSPLPLPPPPKKMNKHSAKQANLVASNATAKALFAQSDVVKSLEEEIARLRKQIQAKEQVLAVIMYYSVLFSVHTSIGEKYIS